MEEFEKLPESLRDRTRKCAKLLGMENVLISKTPGTRQMQLGRWWICWAGNKMKRPEESGRPYGPSFRIHEGGQILLQGMLHPDFAPWES